MSPKERYQDPNKMDKAGRTKIFTSTSSGGLEKVKELIKKGANVNHRDHAGWTPLHVAALKGQDDIAKCLIDNGAKVNVRSDGDDTPLHDACSLGFTSCVKILITAGANVYALNTDKKRPIDICDDKDCIELLKNKMNQLDQLALKDNEGRTSIHRASIQGSIDEILPLLKYGFNVNAKDNLLQTPLHLATQKGDLSMVKLLVDYGADINSIDQTKSTPLHLACQSKHQSIVEYLIELNSICLDCLDNLGRTPYQVTDSFNIRLLITDRIDQSRRLRATTEAIDEVTFISNSKRKQETEVVSLSREERKIQALMKSFENAERKKRIKRKSFRECTIENEITIKKSNSISGKTPLHIESSRGDSHAVKALLKEGVNLNAYDNAGYTPLHVASLKGKLEIVETLLMHHADVNVKSLDMNTPLHDAIENGFTHVVQLLLKYGANVYIKNSKGLTPIDIANKKNHTEIRSFIKTYQDLNDDLVDIKAKVHARQLSGQHLPKKSLKPYIVKTEIPSSTPAPIPTPPPEQQTMIIKNEFNLYPSLHDPSRYLPLYTMPADDHQHFFVLDIQINLLLGRSTTELKHHYPFLYYQIVSVQEKQKVWSPLSSMFPLIEKQTFLETDVYFFRLDQIVSIVKKDYNHLSDRLITITLDMGCPKEKQHIKLPPKFALKMKKCKFY